MRRLRAARQDCPTEMWSSPVFFCRNGPCGQQKSPGGLAGPSGARQRRAGPLQTAPCLRPASGLPASRWCRSGSAWHPAPPGAPGSQERERGPGRERGQVLHPAPRAAPEPRGREPTPAGTAPSAIADPGRRGHGRPGTSAGCTAGGCRRLPAGRRASPPAGAPGTAMPAAPRCPPHSLFEPVLAASVSSCIPRLLCRSPVFFLHYITSAL